MNSPRAALLAALGRYIQRSRIEDVMAADGPSLLEIQKLMYFLQEAGQALSLNYAKNRYGPYAENLNQALEPLEGHYLRGYGDRTQEILKLSPVILMPGAEGEAQRWLDDHPDGATTERINAVMDLVEGFASAYGLELLATVHWAAKHKLATREAGLASVTTLIRNWSERRGHLFTEVHIRRAAEHLTRLHWIDEQYAVR
jgi:hypothetical protein